MISHRWFLYSVFVQRRLFACVCVCHLSPHLQDQVVAGLCRCVMGTAGEDFRYTRLLSILNHE